MSKRRNLLLFTTLFLLAFVASSSYAETIQFWTMPGDPYETTMREVVKKFTEETGIDVEITLVTYGEHKEKLTVAVLGGSPPDVMLFERSSTKEMQATQNVMQPLDNLLRDFDRSSMLPGPMSEAMYNGKWYGMPVRTDVRGVYWNQNLLAEAGLNETVGPKTWDELDLYARKLTKMNGTDIKQLGFAPWYSNWGFPAWVWAFGGEIYDEETNSPIVDTPTTIDVLRWYQTYGDRLGPEGRNFHRKFDSTDASFYKGGLAMYLQSTSFLGRLAVNAPDLSYMTGEVPHPAGGGNGTWSGGPSLIIPRGAKNPELAAKFLKFVARPDMQLLRYRESQAIPANIEALKAAISETESIQTVKLFEQLPVAHGRPPMWVPIRNAYIAARNNVLDGKMAPPAAAADAQTMADAEFARAFGKK